MLSKGVIVQVLPCKNLFLSNLFLVPKNDRDQRPVINLKNLNHFVMYQHFKMEGLYMVKDLLQKGDYLIKIDLKDAYSVMSISPIHRKYLRFQIGEGSIFEYTALPFGLGEAPRLFTKTLKPVIGLLRRLGIRMIVYLDDILLMAFHTFPSPKAGICNKLEKIGVKTITRNRVPRVSNKFTRYDVLSARNQDRKYKTKLQTLAETGKNYCERTGKVNRETFIFNAGNNSSLLTKSFPSNGSDKGPVNGEVLRTRNVPLRRGKTRTVLVGHPDRQLQWENYNNPKSRSRYNLRRLKFRLGSDVSRSKHRGSLVQRRVKFAYKRKRTTGSFPSYTDLYKRVLSFGNSFKTRQYVSG